MMNLSFNPMMPGLTHEGMSMINGTQGVTPYGMQELHGVSMYQSPMQQQMEFHEREQLRMRPLLEDRSLDYSRFDPCRELPSFDRSRDYGYYKPTPPSYEEYLPNDDYSYRRRDYCDF